MDEYRRKIKNRIFVGAIICAVTAGIAVLDVLGVIEKLGFLKKYEVLSTFQFGFLVGITLVAIFYMFKLGIALKYEKKLRILYNEEKDERLLLIRQKSGAPMIVITSTIMVLGGIIAGYINEIVFYTLIAAGFFQLIFSIIAKLYYMRKIWFLNDYKVEMYPK